MVTCPFSFSVCVVTVGYLPSNRDVDRPGGRGLIRGTADRVDGQAGCDSLTAVRLTEFWRRMDEHFGDVYTHSVAKDYVLAGLGGRTIEQALAEGEGVKDVWGAVCAEFQIPRQLA